MSLLSALRSLFFSLLSGGDSPAHNSPPIPIVGEPLPPTPSLPPDFGDVSVGALYTWYDEDSPRDCRLYDRVDPLDYPNVWVAVRGTRLGRVALGLEVDGRMPKREEIKTLDVTEHSYGRSLPVVLPYPQYGQYRATGRHKVRVLIGRDLDPTNPRSEIRWVRSALRPIEVRRRD